MADMAKDKTIIEMETENGKFEVTTLYKAVRKIESTGVTSVGLSYCKLTGSETRAPGQPDKLDVEEVTPMDYVLSTMGSARDNFMNKAVFSCKLKRASFPTSALSVAQRFRWVSVGKNMKPTKPYVVTSAAITLTPGRPKRV